jgi:CheY-like chemotaxis protein
VHPEADEQSAEPLSSGLLNLTPAMTRRTILIIEGDARTLGEIEGVLTRVGFSILPARTGVQALTLVERRPDLILVDFDALDLDALTLCRFLRQDPLTARIPIVAICSDPIEGARAKIMNDVCAGFHVKPFRPRDLLLLLTGILSMEAFG